MSEPTPAAPDDRPEPNHPSDEWWLEPYDGDAAAERDERRVVNRGAEEDW